VPLLLMSWTGVVVVPGAAGGFLLGGIITKRLSLTTEQQLRAMFFLAIVSLCATLTFTIQCDTAPLADQSLHEPDQHTDM